MASPPLQDWGNLRWRKNVNNFWQTRWHSKHATLTRWGKPKCGQQTQPICVGWLEKQNCHGWKCEHGSGERWDEIETRIMASFVAHHPRLWQNGTSCRDALAPSNSMQSPRELRKYTKVPSSSHCVPLAWLLLLICSFASASAAAGTNGGAPGGWKCHKQNLNAALFGFYMLITPGEYSPNDSTPKSRKGQNPAVFQKRILLDATTLRPQPLRQLWSVTFTDSPKPYLRKAHLVESQRCLPRSCNRMQPCPPKTLSRNHRDTEEKACVIEMNVRPMACLLHRHTLAVEGHKASHKHHVIDCDWVKHITTTLKEMK